MVIFLALTLLVAGCGNSGSSNSSSSAKNDSASKVETDKPKENVKISFLHWRGEDVKVFDELIAAFEAENPHIKVEMNVMPSEQYLSSAQAKLLDGSVGDVFASFPGAQFATFLKGGFYTDLSDVEFKDNYSENLIKAGQSDGKQYAFPYQLVYNQPVYNKKIFEELQLTLPNDWEGFLALCETLKQNGYIPIAFPGADIGPGQFLNSMMMNNNTDEEIWDKVETGNAKLTDDWFVKTLSQFKELQDKGYFQDDSLGTSKDIAGALFAQEKAAMLATGSYMMASNKELNPDLEQGLLAPITVSADEAVYEGIHTTTFMLGVNSKSKHQEEAKQFLAFLSQKEHAEKYANDTGQLVTLNDISYTTPELEESAKWVSKHTRFHPRYLIQDAAIEKAVTNSIQMVVAGTDPVKAAEEAQKIVDQNLRK